MSFTVALSYNGVIKVPSFERFLSQSLLEIEVKGKIAENFIRYIPGGQDYGTGILQQFF